MQHKRFATGYAARRQTILDRRLVVATKCSIELAQLDQASKSAVDHEAWVVTRFHLASTSPDKQLGDRVGVGFSYWF